MDKDVFQIKTKAFEGPFPLLLSLIEEKKFFINDLSLAQVTEDYLHYVKQLEKLDPSEISNFVVVAATLILIKSKSLLPDLNLTSEEEGDIRSLEERLRLYELFTRLGGGVKGLFGKKIIFAPMEKKNDFLVFLPDEQITRESMMTFARNALGAMPQKIFIPEVEVKKVISLEEMIERLGERIKSSLKMNFRDFAGTARSKEEKIEVIVGFLAMLELVRQGILNAVQEGHNGDILIEANKDE